MSALDALIYGYRYILAEAVEVARRNRVSFGPGFAITDDATLKATVINLAQQPPGGRRVKMTITATAYQILSTDHVIVSAVDGLTHTLPADPSDGDEYEIKSATGVSGTIVDGGAETIAGAATYEQSEGENTVFRYAGTQWETF